MKSDFLPTASLEMLRQRAKLLKRIRQFFDDREFLEVVTPVLSHDTVVDRYIEPIRVLSTDVGLAGEQVDLWLQTSPEFAMKRILAAGEAGAIYQIAHAFRAGEAGAKHNPEFSMLEWYRVGDDQQQGIQLLGEFACEIFDVEKFDKLEYHSLFQRHVVIDGLSENVSEFVAAAQDAKLDIAAFQGVNDINAWRNLLLTEVIEPQLGQSKPVIVYDWPASQSALATCRPGEPPVAERFELYYRGTELANGYHELLDAQELQLRNREINAKRVADGKQALPESSRLLAAMESGIQPCSGVAVGVDRVLMLLCDKQNISDVMSFPISTA